MRAKLTPLLLLSLMIHVLVFLIVVDIYLTIPSEDGMKHYKAEMVNPPAKRLIFILVDDLQASSLYTTNMSSATPFLYSITKERASWGVVHTQAPTESKLGHVALLSGMYLNPLEILKIWKTEALKFDTVLSQSKKSIIFGTSDFIDSLSIYYFIHIKFYPCDEVIFEEKNGIGTQKWAFKKARQYLTKTASTHSINGMIILMHLTAKNILSAQLIERKAAFNMPLIDKELRAFEIFLTKYYKDEQTAYILTSNLEPTNWGLGALGSRSKTEIPIIAWGAGIMKSAHRRDINSTSIAPLISALLGINFPINSVGIVPLDYLNVKRKDAAYIITANALQLLETFFAKEEKVKSSPLIFTFLNYIKMLRVRITYWRSIVSDFFMTARYDDIIVSTSDIIEKVIEGIKYFNNYFKLLQARVVALAVIGWLLYLVSWLPIFSNVYIRAVGSGDWSYRILREKTISFIYFAAHCSCLSISHFFGLTYYYTLYILFPMTSCYLVYNRLSHLWILYLWLAQLNFKNLFKSLVICIGSIQLLISSFLVRHSLIPVVFGNILYIYNHTNQGPLTALWFLLGCLLCLSKLLPIPRIQNSLWFLFISFSMFSYTVNCLIRYSEKMNNGFSLGLLLRLSTLFQITISLLAYLNVITVRFLFQLKCEPYIFNYSISWLILGAAIILPLFSSSMVIYRVINIVLALVPIYILLSEGLESIFIIIYSLFLLLWVIAEQHITNQERNIWFISFANNASVNFPFFKEDMRRALTFITFAFLGLFGTGDLSTLGSYDNILVAAFIPNTYHHNVGFCLYVLKLFIPFLMAMCCFLSIIKITNMNLSHCVTLVVIICDAIVVQFFLALNIDGSWEHISVNLTKFMVAFVVAVAVILSYFVSRVLTVISTDYIIDLIKRGIDF